MSVSRYHRLHSWDWKLQNCYIRWSFWFEVGYSCGYTFPATCTHDWFLHHCIYTTGSLGSSTYSIGLSPPLWTLLSWTLHLIIFHSKPIWVDDNPHTQTNIRTPTKCWHLVYMRVRVCTQQMTHYWSGVFWFPINYLHTLNSETWKSKKWAINARYTHRPIHSMESSWGRGG